MKGAADDVGGVEAAAEADFEDGDLGAALGEPEEGDGGEALEEGRRMREELM